MSENLHLAHDEGDAVTAEQQGYIRSIKNYLGIADPQTEAVLTDVENIDSTAVQKVFYRNKGPSLCNGTSCSCDT